MELKECITCGSHSFTDNKCDYCGNQYEVNDDNKSKLIYGNTWCDNGMESYAEKFNGLGVKEIDFQETPDGKTLLKIMLIILASIIWFAITVFIPPLFIITIILLVVYGIYRLTKRSK